MKNIVNDKKCFLLLVITLAISITPSFIYAETTVINFEELLDFDRGLGSWEFKGDELVDQHIRFSTPDRALILMNVIPPPIPVRLDTSS